MTLEQLEANEHLVLLKCISGSNAYGLNLPTSDVDYKGVFTLSQNDFYSLHYTEQVNNVSNDIVYYELKRFIDLLQKNNPNILELLNTPADCVLFKHPVLDLIDPQMFLSKVCMQTFAGYAQTQIKRAKGLNKKILNPVDRELKSLLDFCYVISGQGTLSLKVWLQKNNFDQHDCGLISLTHMQNQFAVFHKSQFSPDVKLRGIITSEKSNDVSVSSVPAEFQPLTTMYFNKDGYSAYRKDYHEYWEWVDNRNEERYQNTVQHGKNYDAKNMMHVFRLLNMAEEIAVEKKLNVRRKDREHLLSIRRGDFMYEDLVQQATEQVSRIELLYKNCDLPEKPDEKLANNLLINIRNQLYSEAGFR